MSQHFFLSIPEIPGESTVAGHEKDLQVASWSHSFNQPTNPARSSAGSGTVEQANHADFSLTRYQDAASIPLLKHCWNGRPLSRVTFTAFRSDGENLEMYLKVEMSNVVISNVSVGGTAGDTASETITLAYGAVTYSYFPKGAARDPSLIRRASHHLGQMKVE